MFHFFFLSPADRGGEVSFQMKQVFFHGCDVVHVDGEAVVALEEALIASKDIIQFLVGIQCGDIFSVQVNHSVSGIVTIQGEDAGEGDVQGVLAGEMDRQLSPRNHFIW